MSNHNQMRALQKLTEAQLVLEQRHERTPCMVNPEKYTETPPKSVVEAAMLCTGCPLFNECAGYAQTDKYVSGVWGGVYYPDPLESKIRSTNKKEDI